MGRFQWAFQFFTLGLIHAGYCSGPGGYKGFIWRKGGKAHHRLILYNATPAQSFHELGSGQYEFNTSDSKLDPAKFAATQLKCEVDSGQSNGIVK
jgi:hypothetical protein